MQHLIDATRQAVDQKNWYAALALALTIPDICGRIAYKELRNSSTKRSIKWFESYVPTDVLKLHIPGSDFFALRCAYLHQGEFSLKGQSARQVLDRFHLTIPGGSHNNVFVNRDADGTNRHVALQLDVDIFCLTICDAAEKWLSDTKDNARIQRELGELGKLVSFASLFGGHG